jgi:DNA helicase-2/ATP-dependent DNA helicase PcrA
MQFRLNGFPERLDHVVIDEAQDFSPFQIALLRQVVRQDGLTILGDLAQGIHSDQGTTDWQVFEGLFPEGHVKRFDLIQSYRSTMEIIHFSNAIIRQTAVGVAEAIPVLRSGDPVRLIPLSAAQHPNDVASWLKQVKRRAESIAIVTRTESEARRIHEELSQEGIIATFITANQREYTPAGSPSFPFI